MGCPGRVDVSAEVAAEQSKNLNPEIYLDPETATAPKLRESMKIMGFTDREMVVLNGGGHAIGQCHHFRSGFQGPWTTNPAELSNEFFHLLLQRDWVETTVPQTGKKQFIDSDTGTLMMLFSDMLFRDDDKFRAIVEEYAQDNDLFLEDFRNAWIKLVNADRFGGVCVTSDTKESTTTTKPMMSMPEMMEPAPAATTVTCENSQETSALTWAMIVVMVVIIFVLLVQLFVQKNNVVSSTPAKTEDKGSFAIEMTQELSDRQSDKLGGSEFEH